MKKLTFWDMFLLTAFLIAVAGKWSVWTCILLIAAAVLELVDVIEKWRRLNGRK